MHYHETRIAGGNGGVVEAPFLQPAGAEVLQHDVDVVDESSEKVAAPFVAEVDGDGALVAGDAGPPQALAVESDAPTSHGIALPRGLDLDDLGPVVTEELAGERSRDEAAELEHPHAGQRSEARRGGVDGRRLGAGAGAGAAAGHDRFRSGGPAASGSLSATVCTVSYRAPAGWRWLSTSATSVTGQLARSSASSLGGLPRRDSANVR